MLILKDIVLGVGVWCLQLTRNHGRITPGKEKFEKSIRHDCWANRSTASSHFPDFKIVSAHTSMIAVVLVLEQRGIIIIR
jgi:hypothetical protein